MDIEKIWPPYGVTITAGDLVLAVTREGDSCELVDLVLDGVHDPDFMPFLFPWTDAPREEVPGNYLQYLARTVAGFSPSSFSLQFVVRRNGEAVGIQGLEANSNFRITRTLETGSWLARRFHGQGIGTRMRQAVCAFAFDVLGATEITSGAFLDNGPSQAVSRKVGYRPNGIQRMERREQLAQQQLLVLTEADLVRGEPITVTGADPLLAQLGLSTT
ncbi:MAG: GNAT family N-acetyltransferase [Propionibacteriales bacterium]|nr:GNAT family N-acetyltransferase [Propionibacteriales bacterium]